MKKMKTCITKCFTICLCMGMVVLLTPAAMRAEENQTVTGGQTTNVVSAPAKADTSDVYIKNFQQWKTNRVIFGNEAPVNQGAKGVQIQVSRVKDGKVVYDKEGFQIASSPMEAKEGVLYRYRIRYYNYEGYDSGNPRAYGEWSDYRYYGIPSVSGKRTNSSLVVKWKKMEYARGYDCYVKAVNSGKRSLGKMNRGIAPAKDPGKDGFKKIKTLGKKSTSFTVTKVGKQKISRKKQYSVMVLPRLYVGGKKVANDLNTWLNK